MSLSAAALLLSGPSVQPFTPAPHAYLGQMCGVHVDGLPKIPGCANDPTLVLSWFYPFYESEWRTKIRAAWKAKGYLDSLQSWPDARARGFSPQQFLASMQELIADGFRPAVMWTSKAYDPADVPAILAALQDVLPLFVGVIPRCGIGWELNLWLSPTQVQQLTDAIAPMFVKAQCKVYVHFFGYMSFPEEGEDNAAYWKRQVGKLTGLWHERDPDRNPTIPSYLDTINDQLERFAGNDGMPSDNGIDGQPFDDIELEITAQMQFDGSMTEAEGDLWAMSALNAPGRSGPAGVVYVMGSGNGS